MIYLYLGLAFAFGWFCCELRRWAGRPSKDWHDELLEKFNPSRGGIGVSPKAEGRALIADKPTQNSALYPMACLREFVRRHIVDDEPEPAWNYVFGPAGGFVGGVWDSKKDLFVTRDLRTHIQILDEPGKTLCGIHLIEGMVMWDGLMEIPYPFCPQCDRLAIQIHGISIPMRI